LWRDALICLVLGVIGGFASSPRHLWPLVVLCLAGFFYALLKQSGWRAALLGFAFGLGWFAVLVSWMQVVGFDAWLGLTMVCAIPLAIVGALCSRVGVLTLGPVWVASVWVAGEAVRDRFPFGGFPWGRLSFATGSESDRVLSFGGPTYVSFLLCLGAALAAVIARRMRLDRSSVRTDVLAALAIGLVSVSIVWIPQTEEGAPVGSLTVAVIQGGVPGQGLDFLGRARTVTRNHAKQTVLLAQAIKAGKQPKPDLVVWPENSTDLDPRLDNETEAIVQSAVDAIGVPILLGAVLEVGNQRLANAAVLWNPQTGPRVVYTKQRPVPFGEFLPYRDQISGLSDKFALLPRDFVAGTESGQITIKGVRLGMVICFEVAHDNVVHAAVRDGGEVLVVLTNNATYATTDQPEQQFDITRQRAVEFARPVVVAATTGISAAINAQGNVTTSLAQNRGGYFVAEVQGSSQITTQARYGVALELFFVMLAILAIAIRVIIRPIRHPEDRVEQETS